MLIPPVAGVFIADFFSAKHRYEDAGMTSAKALRPLSLLSWAIGSAIAFATVPEVNNGLGLFTLTHVSALDRLLVGALVQMVICKVKN